MPSFRITMAIGSLHAGVAPGSVLPAAARAVSELTTVEATDVSVVRGSPRLTVRYAADDDAAARRIADHTCRRTQTLAEIVSAQLTRRQGSRWYPV